MLLALTCGVLVGWTSMLLYSSMVFHVYAAHTQLSVRCLLHEPVSKARAKMLLRSKYTQHGAYVKLFPGVAQIGGNRAPFPMVILQDDFNTLRAKWKHAQ